MAQDRATGSPGMTPVLSPQDHDHFLEHGYVVVRNAVPPETIAVAVAVLEAGRFEGKPGAADYKPVQNEAVVACTTDKMHDAIQELFGAEYPFKRRRGGSDMPRPHQPNSEWKLPTAHVDDSYPEIMPNGWAVGSFIFLTPVKPRGGGFIYFPGSPNRYRQAMARSFNCGKGVAAVPDYSGPGYEYLAQPGDVLLFNQLLGHAGSSNVSDPTTRHALLSRWHPDRRIVPGRKPFEQMSTLEKAYSARFLNHRFGLGLNMPEVIGNNRTGAALRDGFLGCDQMATYGLLQFGGQANLLFVDRAQPAVIRRSTSQNLVDWHDTGRLDLSVGRVRTLHLHQYTAEAILSVCTEDGKVTLFSTLDFERWSRLDEIEGFETATPFYVYAQYPSKVAEKQALYLVPPASPSQALCRWGERWETASQWKTNSLALQAPEGSRIVDLTIVTKFADSNCAFVADMQPPGTDTGRTQPFYVLPKDIAVANEPLQPLPHSCPTPPRQIRVYHRARNYWLVSYVRRHQGQDRVFWGAIDWELSPVMLREITSPEAFDEALCIVGMI